MHVYLYIHVWFEICTRIYLSIQICLLKICKNYIFESLNCDEIVFLKKIAIIDHHVGYQSGECRDRK